jgi:hypothetical protein
MASPAHFLALLGFRIVLSCLAVLATMDVGTVAKAQDAPPPQLPPGWRFSIDNDGDYVWTSPSDARGSTVTLFIEKNMSQDAPRRLTPGLQSFYSNVGEV